MVGGEWRGRETMRNMIIFFNETAATEIYTLALNDARPISVARLSRSEASWDNVTNATIEQGPSTATSARTMKTTR